MRRQTIIALAVLPFAGCADIAISALGHVAVDLVATLAQNDLKGGKPAVRDERIPLPPPAPPGYKAPPRKTNAIDWRRTI